MRSDGHTRIAGFRPDFSVFLLERPWGQVRAGAPGLVAEFARGVGECSCVR